MSEIEIVSIEDMVKAASDNCVKNHSTYHPECYFCRFDKSIIDALAQPTPPTQQKDEL